MTAANLLTALRILGSAFLLLFPVPSTGFSILYLLCGLSDMIDGTIARKTNTSSAFGAKLDTAADISLFAISFYKLLPQLYLPLWLWGWAAVIAGVKLCNLSVCWLREKTLLSLHTPLNKPTGFFLFLFPLTLSVIELTYTAPIVCIIAMTAAINESRYLLQNRQHQTGHAGSGETSQRSHQIRQSEDNQ